MIWKCLGWVFVAIGVTGVFVPVMPTVPFLLVAAFCFERGSPELHRWILSHPTFGPPLAEWKKHRVIRPKAKVLAVAGISMSVAYVLFFKAVALWVKILMCAVCFSVVTFILTRKSRPDREEVL